jgi:hypothetical protein
MRVLRGKSGAETLKKHQARTHSLARKQRQPPSPGKSQTPEKNVIDRISGSPEVKGCSWFEYSLTEHHQLGAPHRLWHTHDSHPAPAATNPNGEFSFHSPAQSQGLEFIDDR